MIEPYLGALQSASNSKDLDFTIYFVHTDIICRTYEVATFAAKETRYATCVGLRAVFVALAMSGVEGYGAETEGRDPGCGRGGGWQT